MKELTQSATLPKWSYGKAIFDYTVDKVEYKVGVFFIVENSDGDKRYFTNAVTSKAAFDELTIHKASFNTLSKNFTGRTQIDMHTYLVKNHIKKAS